MIIYKATNKIDGKCYIGQTIKTLKKRKQQHITFSKTSNYYFHNALKKYGKENFKWEILEDCYTFDELNEMEFHYIKQYHSHYSENGYNIDKGGSGGNQLFGKDNGMYGKNHKKTSKNKMSESRKGNITWNKGIPRTDEVKNKISEKNTGNTAWNKGLSVENDLRVKKYSKNRNKTMIEKSLYKKGRNHPRFVKLDEKLIIKYINEKMSYTKIGEKMNVSRRLISRRLKLLKEEGML